MAVADSVPGVSGGTIAFLLGFYEKFISSVHCFLFGTNAERKAAFPFLFKLGVGWVGGFVVCVLILSTLFHTYIYEISSVFIGLTLAAVPIVIFEEKEFLRGRYLHLIFTAVGVAVVPVLMSLSPAVGGGGGVDLTDASIGLAVYLFIAAIIAVSALVLPGISGSTLLLIMGLYVPLISAVLHREFSYIPMLFVFGLGMIAGLAVSAKVIRHCFARYRSQTIYLCVGLLIGSLYAIVLGSTTLSDPLPAMSWGTFNLGFCILGAGVLAVLQVMKRRMERKGSVE
jgi:putative membrane protein